MFSVVFTNLFLRIEVLDNIVLCYALSIIGKIGYNLLSYMRIKKII